MSWLRSYFLSDMVLISLYMKLHNKGAVGSLFATTQISAAVLIRERPLFE